MNALAPRGQSSEAKNALAGYSPPPARNWLRPFDEGERRENPDGSYSTELIATEYLPDGSIANFPTLWMTPDGPVQLGVREAMQAALEYERATGKKMPRFKSIDEAVRYAQTRSRMGGRGVAPAFE